MSIRSRWSYEHAVQHLLSYVNYETLTSGRPMVRSAADLARFESALGALSHPERCAPAIHVAGTNGKGSTSAVAAALLARHGWKVGLYTSPHLVDVRERIQVSGKPVGRLEFARAVQEASGVIAGESGGGFRTTFEILTASAFLAFRERGVEAMVVEVGLGGRLDSTNVVVPRVAVITPISLDHTEVLGTTIAAIARDKGGILKHGIQAVSARQDPAAASALRQVARRAKVRLETMDDVEILSEEATSHGEAFGVRTPWATYPDLVLPLKGRHQVENAIVGLRAVELFLGRSLDSALVRRGLHDVRWPGRFQILSRKPGLVVDGAHNPAGASTLVAALDRYFPGRPAVFVLGVSKGKDAGSLLGALKPRAAAVVTTAAAHPRAEDPEALAGMAGRILECPVDSARTPQKALVRSRRVAEPDGIVCVAGSLYLVGEVLEMWPSFRAQWSGKVGASRLQAAPV